MAGRASHAIRLAQEICDEKNPGWLFDIGDEILPRYMGIMINHYEDPY